MSPSQIMPSTKRHIFSGTFIHCKTRTELEFMHDSVICVDEQGVIARIRKGCQDIKETIDNLTRELDWEPEEIDLFTCKEGQFFFPGFIDTHIHAPQYPNAGIFGKTTLLDWLDKYTFPIESSLRDLKKARRVYTACIRRTLAHGTTTASYFATNDVEATNLLADLCLSYGQRALVGRVCMDNRALCPDFYCDESPEASAKATRQTIQHVRAIDPTFSLVTPIITPRFAPACTSAALHGIARLQREEAGGEDGRPLPIQTHVSENRGEVALVARMFPASTSYADVYDQHGLLGPRTVLAHGVHLTEAEATLVAARGAKIAHCPCSNTALTSGAARVRWLWKKGIDVGLGTDVSGGYSSSVLEGARQAALVSRHVAMDEIVDQGEEGAKLTVEEVLYLATRGGAICVGLEDQIGGFEEGKQWDAQLVGFKIVGDGDGDGAEEEIDDGNVDIFGWEDWEERIAKWLYGGDDRNTKRVYVKGRLVHSRR